MVNDETHSQGDLTFFFIYVIFLARLIVPSDTVIIRETFYPKIYYFLASAGFIQHFSLFPVKSENVKHTQKLKLNWLTHH